ncbi:hypothetical protein JCM3774_001852 [Rhodotorula dairenensis]
MLSAQLAAPLRRAAWCPAQAAGRLSPLVSGRLALRRPYVTSPLTPDPDAKPAAADLPVKPAYDNVPFAAPTNKDETQGQLGQVKLPDMARIENDPDQESAVRIPTAPDTYRSAATSPDAPPDPVGHTPQVATASHPSTYPGGGPSLNKAGQDGDVVIDEGEPPRGTAHHHNQKNKGDESSEAKASSSSSSLGRAKSSTQQDQGNDEKSYKYEWQDRSLEADEKQGLYLLGAMLAGGYVLSVATDPRRRRKA